jgi:ElaB/YqjD/DUF883 family membrane-anchored ribosome-binding protein
MFSRSIDKEVDALAQTLSELREQIGSLTRRVGGEAESVLDDGRRQAQRVRAMAGDVATQLRGHAGTVQDEMSQHPVASVTAGFVIGLLIGRFFMR